MGFAYRELAVFLIERLTAREFFLEIGKNGLSAAADAAAGAGHYFDKLVRALTLADFIEQYTGIG
jgi:hypothetical protein